MSAQLVDPRDVIKCACPRIDGRDCIRFRCKDDMREMLGDEPICADYDMCECACHGPEDDFDDEGTQP